MLAKVLAAAAMLGSSFAAHVEAAPGLASPMVDTAIYRDGAVVRSHRRFGAWDLVCDEIHDLRQRYCSLRSTLPTTAVVLDVSTGDDGRPAALLHLPVTVSLHTGVRIAPMRDRAPGPPRSTHREGRAVAITVCDARECLAAWSLAPSELDALNKGKGLALDLCITGNGSTEFVADLRSRPCGDPVTAEVTSAGFAAAVAASLE